MKRNFPLSDILRFFADQNLEDVPSLFVEMYGNSVAWISTDSPANRKMLAKKLRKIADDLEAP